ncbi:fibronectin type III domain-containing protein [Streptomyces sp. AC550_RSS872]|uniref:fibronectin type III domain-containing protein n=1 Tax=Streptomyces sp. AC550_RSS872 TaxID=2823689 RepID=UPI0027E44294|nr:fibronectin type III domain-containing protein [Streptomyces sp. AC550_RSS872]
MLRTAATTSAAAATTAVWLPAPATASPHTSRAAAAPGRLDLLDFGDPDSEKAHGLAAAHTTVVDGNAGDRARVAQPLDPPDIKAGELRFTMKVDPVRQNYFTVKFWGSDPGSYKTIAYINGEQIGYRRGGDYEALNLGTNRPLPGRFFYSTTMLPLEHTQGRTVVEITLRTYDAVFAGPVTSDSRGYYRAYTHTGAHLDLDGDPQADFTPPTDTVPDLGESAKQDLMDGYVAGQVKLFNAYSAKVDASPKGNLSIVRYQDELRFYAAALQQASWCPARTAAERKAALLRIFTCIDNHTKDYYGNTKLLARGGHQGDWGGYYGALGEALYIVENLIADNDVYGRDAFDAFLDEPFTTGTEDGPTSLKDVDFDGGPLTRRAAWGRVLKANFDYARSRLSYIFNQVMYTYEGAWEAHEGLRIIDSPFYEGRERSHRIVGEALGWEPFLGEEVLVGPEGQDLDLFHSLFAHDAAARWTDDYLRYVIKGLARSKLDTNGKVVRRLPFGRHYTTITEAGLTRENGYVANYGESTNYLPEWFHRTWGHAGDEELNDRILRLALKNLHARSLARHTDLDDNLKRTMRMEMVVDERNPSFPGFPGYAVRIAEGKILNYVSLAHHIDRHPERYSGSGWAQTRRHAREALGFAQQQLADHKYFSEFGSVTAKNKTDLKLGETYAWLKEQKPTGIVHPHTDFAYYTAAELDALAVRPADYEHFAWVDVDCMFVSLRDGDTHIFGQLNERQRGFARNGRLHVRHADRDHLVQLRTNARFSYEDYWTRMDNIDVDFMEDTQTADSGAPQALAGEIAPITFQSGVGTVRRENFEADHAYSGYPDLLTARYGRYFFVFNTTRTVYGNARTHTVELPSDHRGDSVPDLVTKRRIPASGGRIEVPPKTGLVLKLSSANPASAPPAHVDFVHTLPGDGALAVTWQTAAGATHYQVRRATRQGGPYALIAPKATGLHHVDPTARPGRTYYYTVTAVNAQGPGWTSHAVRARLPEPVTGGLRGTGWRDDALFDTRPGSVAVRGAGVRVIGAKGDGLGEGDDYMVPTRTVNDQLHYVSRPLAGGFTLTARLDVARGPQTGLMLRDRATADTRHMYFGADNDGRLVLRVRNRDSRHDWQDEVRSPVTRVLDGHSLSATPWLRLVRDVATHRVLAQVSKDGKMWTTAGSVFAPFPFTVLAGFAATGDAEFTRTGIAALPVGTLLVGVERAADVVTIRWNKPEDAVSFTLLRSTGDGPWERIARDTRALAHRDEGLRHGTRRYRVTALLADGGTRESSAAAVAVAEPLPVLLARARATEAKDWTKASYASFTAELDRIENDAENTDADLDRLIDDVYTAYDLLVSVDTLLTKVEVTQEMVTASTIQWPGIGTRESNAWRAFDGDPTTYTDTLAAESWIDVKSGPSGPLTVDRIRFHPRSDGADKIGRANGTVFKGSNDGGATWTDLHTISGVSEARWYEATLAERAVYELIRVYDAHDGRCNLAEIELCHFRPDER